MGSSVLPTTVPVDTGTPTYSYTGVTVIAGAETKNETTGSLLRSNPIQRIVYTRTRSTNSPTTPADTDPNLVGLPVFFLCVSLCLGSKGAAWQRVPSQFAIWGEEKPGNPHDGWVILVNHIVTTVLA